MAAFLVKNGRSEELLSDMPESSVDSVVTDPPYGLKFMGRKWDYSVPKKESWEQVYRVLKPGGHALIFGGSRTFHRVAVEVEDAGFEIRDMLAWIYGSGFPKSLDISKAIDKKLGAEREKVRIPAEQVGNFKNREDSRPWIEEAKEKGYHEMPGKDPASPEDEKWAGWGTGLKPGHEPILLVRKPFPGTVAENVLKYGTGGINIDGGRIGERFPSNLLHDGSEEVLEIFPGTGEKSAARFFYCAKASKKDRNEGLGDEFKESQIFGDNGGTYQGLSNSKNPDKNPHPTVKPEALMRYLCRLITPPGGVILDPFMGSGSTGKAAILEGFRFIGFDLDPLYVDISRARIEKALEDSEK